MDDQDEIETMDDEDTLDDEQQAIDDIDTIKSDFFTNSQLILQNFNLKVCLQDFARCLST